MRHIDTVHLKKRFGCVLCVKDFSDSSNLNRHYKNIHPLHVRHANDVKIITDRLVNSSREDGEDGEDVDSDDEDLKIIDIMKSSMDELEVRLGGSPDNKVSY